MIFKSQTGRLRKKPYLTLHPPLLFRHQQKKVCYYANLPFSVGGIDKKGRETMIKEGYCKLYYELKKERKESDSEFLKMHHAAINASDDKRADYLLERRKRGLDASDYAIQLHISRCPQCKNVEEQANKHSSCLNEWKKTKVKQRQIQKMALSIYG
jgi:hypothetical protein